VLWRCGPAREILCMHAALAETNLAGLLYLQSVSRSPFRSFDLAFSSLTPIATTTIDMVHSEHQAFYSESPVRFLWFSLLVLPSILYIIPVPLPLFSYRGWSIIWAWASWSLAKYHRLYAEETWASAMKFRSTKYPISPRAVCSVFTRKVYRERKMSVVQYLNVGV
jgi:hypothetical protein